MADETRVGLCNLSGTDPTKAMELIGNTADVPTATPLSSILLYQAKAAAEEGKERVQEAKQDYADTKVE